MNKTRNLQDTDAATARDNGDFFPTPAALVTALLGLPIYSEIDPLDPLNSHRQFTILDPAAGNGAFGAGIRDRWPDAWLTGIEPRPCGKPTAYDFWYQHDFLQVCAQGSHKGHFDAIFTNPPYGFDFAGRKDRKLVDKFILAGLELLRPGGYLGYLVHSRALFGEWRDSEIFQKYPNKFTYLVIGRPSFTADGHTEADGNYVWLVWEKGWTGDTIERRIRGWKGK